ncbi:OadG family transporter subunit [Psychrobium sp. 1_MG-2023]|uniref:OadG family transporter subunit n=1 Tax=Psychrobium sp. 1_MG-2023 TaxID=3062624 RepID=UPI000C32FF5D|nr:OadG family transporter subunit [Psychrobium sp. 1_MG-2023]MDP2562390.1 OadG family transporter subunit [Psychrobium sp. 1_MG-2023]PKF55845.1 oxaloacetate decarboxylase subunit gamma [Alteromonadales bacterium alter-6D02]
MDISQALATAANIMLLGMVCVFVFLGLLVVAINLLAKFCPEEVVPAPAKPTNTNDPLNPDVVAAITAAVHKYRQSRE